MSYLLDTNICIALMSSTPSSVRTQFWRLFQKGEEFFISSIVAFELWYGVFKSSRPVENTRRYEAFCAGPINIIPFEITDARLAGELRAILEAAGRPIGAYDLLIAGQAIRHNMTLVTANVSEFSRVKGLLWEDWSK